MIASEKYPQLFLRLALGIGFIFPVLDRLGCIGHYGEPNIGWGDWEHFIQYTSTLTPYLNRPFLNAACIIATVLEASFGILLIIGLKTRLVAIGSFALTLIFAFSMAFFSGYKAPLNYSVFTCSAASLLLSSLPFYSWSIDSY